MTQTEKKILDKACEDYCVKPFLELEIAAEAASNTGNSVEFEFENEWGMTLAEMADIQEGRI